MTIKKIILLFTFSLLSQLVFSTSHDSLLLKKVLVQLKFKEAEINFELATDKVLPYSQHRTVLVIPKYRVNEEDEYGNSSFELDAYIIIANTITGEILYKLHEPNAWTSDAIRLTNIEIDTGLYNLNKKTRAFGIRVNYSNSSQPNPYNQTVLSLYIVEKNTLKRVLENFVVSEFHGEWDTRCNGEFEDKNSVIDIDKSESQNLTDLIIKTTIVKTKAVATKDDCIEEKKSHKYNRRLKYNGVEYK